MNILAIAVVEKWMPLPLCIGTHTDAARFGFLCLHVPLVSRSTIPTERPKSFALVCLAARSLPSRWSVSKAYYTFLKFPIDFSRRCAARIKSTFITRISCARARGSRSPDNLRPQSRHYPWQPAQRIYIYVYRLINPEPKRSLELFPFDYIIYSRAN